jgi:hypothetical protein
MWAKRSVAHMAVILLFVTACQKRQPVVPLPRVAAPAPPLVAFPPPRIVTFPEPPVALPLPARPTPALAALEQADRSFSNGVYDEAARGYEDYLRLLPPGCPCDQELFRLGLSYVLRRSPNSDWERATAVLKQLVEEYPDSPFKAPANLILTLRTELDHRAANTAASTRQRDERIRQLNSELDRLNSELDRLKKIDSDRRRRP